MLNQTEKDKLNQALIALQSAQVKDKENFIARTHLSKSGDEHWEAYKAKQLLWFKHYQDKEYRAYRAQYTRALYDARKGKLSPFFDVN